MTYKHQDVLTAALQDFVQTTPGGAFVLLMFDAEGNGDAASNLTPVAQTRVIELYLAHVRASQ